MPDPDPTWRAVFEGPSSRYPWLKRVAADAGFAEVIDYGVVHGFHPGKPPLFDARPTGTLSQIEAEAFQRNLATRADIDRIEHRLDSHRRLLQDQHARIGRLASALKRVARFAYRHRSTTSATTTDYASLPIPYDVWKTLR